MADLTVYLTVHGSEGGVDRSYGCPTELWSLMSFMSSVIHIESGKGVRLGLRRKRQKVEWASRYNLLDNFFQMM